jgi:hypothetical protein
MSGLTLHLGRGVLVAGLAVLFAGSQRAEAMPHGSTMGFGGGASKTSGGWAADLRLADITGCPGILVCIQVTAVRWRPGAGGSVDDFDRHLRTNAAKDFALDKLDPGGAAGGGGSWSFLNIGPSVYIPFTYNGEVGLNPYYQVEWLTTQGIQARHIVGAEFHVINVDYSGTGFKLGAEWEKQGDFSAINMKLMIGPGQMDT